jgi:magnesium-transporting ATPase (P-type)
MKQSCIDVIKEKVLCMRGISTTERSIYFTPVSAPASDPATFSANVIRNQKYSVITFLPLFLYEQFRYFFNQYFLLVALTQFFPVLQVGFLFTYVAPLVFVLLVAMIKEGYEDFKRFLRDTDANNELFSRLSSSRDEHGYEHGHIEDVPSSQLKVGDLVVLHQDQRVPADMILLRTTEKNGSIFIRTDQLDGETDWKLRRAVAVCQRFESDNDLLSMCAIIQAEPPRKEIYDFAGSFTLYSSPSASASVSASVFASASSHTHTHTHTPLNASEAMSIIENSDRQDVESLGLEQTLWMNTVIASGSVIGCVVYTGRETRSTMNASVPHAKMGKLDMELNSFSKVLFLMTLLLAASLTLLKGFNGIWPIYFFRFVLLLSSIIPISLRVNLDLGKMLYSVIMMRDEKIKGTVVRTSTIPEELGRISYLFSDKTGTLTRNVMTFHTLQMRPPLAFNRSRIHHLQAYLASSYGIDIGVDIDRDIDDRDRDRDDVSSSPTSNDTHTHTHANQPYSSAHSGSRQQHRSHRRKAYDFGMTEEDQDQDQDQDQDVSLDNMLLHNDSDMNSPDLEWGAIRGSSPHSLSSVLPSNGIVAADIDPNDAQHVRRVITAIALCHNVTPVRDDDNTHTDTNTGTNTDTNTDSKQAAHNPATDTDIDIDIDIVDPDHLSYQASSPDEVALVKFAESVGLRLVQRDQKFMSLLTPQGKLERYEILNLFPFTSETKRMGIIVRSVEDGIIYFFLKGAESVMQSKIYQSDWLEEEVDNLARQGLRTLVIAYRILSENEYHDFARHFNTAKSVIKNRESQVASVVRTLERDLELLGLTGVEDKLQHGVRHTLETLRNAGIKVWMLTGDKAETAICIGRSACLIDRNQSVFPLIVRNKRDAARQLDVFGTKISSGNASLVIDGPSLDICLVNFEKEFLDLACAAPSVICCRCSPTQKAQIVDLMRHHTGKRTAGVGDGGNDVNMIQTADVGIGIVGKEGKQASLAADFSIMQFSYLSRLILWHGRNSYKRSARLSQFVIHRGLVISAIQVIFSIIFYYAAIAIYNGWLMVGYATYYTSLPVFSLVLDEDISVEHVFLYPQLYRDLQKGRPMSWKTFFSWAFISFYQGGIIMILAIVLFEDNFINVVGITFTSLILCELTNVALEINKWSWPMLAALLSSIAIYVTSVAMLKGYFDAAFLMTWTFFWKVCAITSIATLPPAIIKCIHRRWRPPVHEKVQV